MKREPENLTCNLAVMTALENKTHKREHLPEQSEMHEKQTFTKTGAVLSLYRDKLACLTFTMINQHFFEIVLVLLASSTLFSLELKLALFQQRVNRESLKLLNKLQKSSVQPCLLHRMDFLLPQQSVNQSRQALAVLHEMLLQIFNLFRADISLNGWEESHMENFLTELHQQLEYLEALRGLEAEQKKGVLSGGNPRLQVKMYFRRIHDYLENQEYSRCAWTIVRVEINRCLFFAFQLIRKLSKQEKDSLHVEQEPTAGFESIG